MKNLRILPKITKTYILQRITQEEIAYYYTKIPVNNNTLKGNSFLSPLRKDNKHTCNYYYNNNNKLRLKDWNGSFDGDVFDIVSLLGFKDIKPNPRTPQGFQLILHKIAKDFKLNYYGDKDNRIKFENHINTIKYNKFIKVFKIVPRPLLKLDKRYWYDKYGISSKLLKEAKVIPVKELKVENNEGYINTVYRYKSYNPVYAYYGGKVKGVNIWKIYFPLKIKGFSKFMTNKSFIQGHHLLKLRTPFLVITKSYKDALCITTFGIDAIALPSESTSLTKDQYLKYKSYYDVIISVMDYDRTGIRMANRLKKDYNIIPIMFTRGLFNSVDYGIKDFSDFVDIYGRDKMKKLLKSVLNKYKYLLDDINNYTYNKLKWLKNE